MPIASLRPNVALVLLDLQYGITALPTVVDADTIVRHAARAAAAFRRAGKPVILVRTAFARDGADLLNPPSDAPPGIAGGRNMACSWAMCSRSRGSSSRS